MKSVTAILVAGCGMASFFGGCTHTHRLDGVKVGEPERPAGTAPLNRPLTESEIIEAARREAERRRIPLHEFKGPHVQPSYAGDQRWCVFYSRDLFPGDHFMVVVDALTGATEFVGGE